MTGADSAIGRAAAIAFAREGADVAVGYLESGMADGQAVAKLIEAEAAKERCYLAISPTTASARRWSSARSRNLAASTS